MCRESIFWRGSEQFELAAMARVGWKFRDESLCLSEIGLGSGGRRRIAKQAVSVGNPPGQNQNRAKAPSPRGMGDPCAASPSTVCHRRVCNDLGIQGGWSGTQGG